MPDLSQAPERDPKTDPRVDDAFRKTKRGASLATEYEVIGISLSRLTVYLRCVDGPYRGCCTRKHITVFRKWAADATVVRKAE